ncbi:MAG: Gfo/Idh/MocA family oxidoreductase [Thermoguttaceae bacterium]
MKCSRSVSRSGVSRRVFLASGSAVAFAATMVPRHVLGGKGQLPPSERVRLAGIGVGGQGGADLSIHASKGAEIVALCDVDQQRAAATLSAFPKAARYRDFRVMLEKEGGRIDAVTVATPDHTHAVATAAAIHAGKHVYCQKPLTHTIQEARTLAQAARSAGVISQMGNQGHATEGARLSNEWIAAGLIGEVREVHCWTDRAGLYWRTGIDRPADKPPVPPSLDWNLWLGPVRERPYHPIYVPATWKGWWDFGSGGLGDMGAHLIDHPVWALGLGAPMVVEARATLDGTILNGNRRNLETYPIAAIITFEFPASGNRGPVTLTWYDGGLKPPTPAEMAYAKGRQQLDDNGVLYVGTKGKMYHGSHGGMPSLLPSELHEDAAKVPKTIPRSPGHYEEWLAACKGGPKPMSNFDYAGPLTEILLLGVLALRMPYRRLHWDSLNMKVTNAPELDPFVHIEYRKGWSL